MPNASRTEGWASAPPEDRAADVHAAFADDEVAAVLRGIGGNHSNQLLPLLDHDLIRGLREVVERRTDAAGLPVLANVEAGHADPMVTLPFGVDAEVDAGARTLRLLEPPTVG